MAPLVTSSLTLGADLDAYLASAVLDGARLADGRVVKDVRQDFVGGAMTQTQTAVKAAGWSPSASDADMEGLRALLTARGVTIPSTGSKLARLRSVMDQLAVSVD